MAAGKHCPEIGRQAGDAKIRMKWDTSAGGRTPVAGIPTNCRSLIAGVLLGCGRKYAFWQVIIPFLTQENDSGCRGQIESIEPLSFLNIEQDYGWPFPARFEKIFEVILKINIDRIELWLQINIMFKQIEKIIWFCLRQIDIVDKRHSNGYDDTMKDAFDGRWLK